MNFWRLGPLWLQGDRTTITIGLGKCRLAVQDRRVHEPSFSERNGYHRVLRIGPWALRVLTSVLLIGCGEDFALHIDGGPPQLEAGADAIISPDSPSDPLDADPPGDSTVIDSSDAKVSADADAGPQCVSGTMACEDIIGTFCARMKSCCNGACIYSWANNGGSECHDHFTGQLGSSGCGEPKWANNSKCEAVCVADVQSASCMTIKQSSSSSQVSGACMSFWQ